MGGGGRQIESSRALQSLIHLLLRQRGLLPDKQQTAISRRVVALADERLQLAVQLRHDGLLPVPLRLIIRRRFFVFQLLLQGVAGDVVAGGQDGAVSAVAPIFRGFERARAFRR